MSHTVKKNNTGSEKNLHPHLPSGQLNIDSIKCLAQL